jgi:DNA-binding transcriptional LysR family regulator
MFRFTVRQIEIYAAVERKRSFRKASEILGISQAAVSEQMRSLEAQVGTTLFRRQPGKSIELTKDGTRFKANADMFIDAGRALGDMFREAERPPIRMFVGLFLLNAFVRPMLPRFMLENSDLRIDFVDPSSGFELFDWVDRGEIDCALISRPKSLPPGEFKTIFTEYARVYASAAIAEIVANEGIESVPFIVWHIPMHSVDDQMEILKNIGVTKPIIHSKVQHHEVAMDLAISGAGAVIMLDSTVQVLDPSSALRPICPAGEWDRRLYLSPRLPNRVRDRLAEFFIEVAGR